MSTVRQLLVDLDAPGGGEAASPRAWTPPRDGLAAAGAWGGAAAALAGAAGGEDGLQLAVGPAVLRGVATAARAMVVGRAALTGRLGEGLVGSDLAARLAPQADLVTLRGRTDLAGAVLVVEGGRARLESLPELVGATPAEAHAALVRRLGPCASLRVGPAGEAGVAWANLAAGDEPASYVGRGGLGATLAAHGLKAIAVVGAPADVGADDALDSLSRALTRSPRLVARAEGGTFELAHARAARGDLDPAAAAALGEGAARRRAGRHGCRGCPTPCGWTFEVPGGPRARQGARFSAVHALGAALGLDPDDALGLLARCNDLGLDAKEAGAGLALAVAAGEAPAGDAAALGEVLERAGRGELLREGAAAFARARGLADPTAGGEATRDESDLAARLGTRAAVRGAEPMRSAPFLAEGGAGRARLAALVAPLELPAGAEDPRDPRGKGRLVWWHENLAAAVDASGFCAFAAAGALADGVLDLDALADGLEPGLDGATLLARGAALVALVAEANERLGAPRPAPADLELPGLAPEYRALRGLAPDGRRLPAGRFEAVLAGPAPVLERAPADGPEADGPEPHEPPPTAAEAAPGQVALACAGALARHLGPAPTLALALPAPALEVLRAAAARWPAAAPLLVDGDRPVPAVYRDGARLGAGSAVRDGDRLDLVLAVSGG